MKNSRHIMEPQLKFGYKKAHSTLFFFYVPKIKKLI